LSKFQKRRQRHRLRAVDTVVATIDQALAKQGETLKILERWKAEMPTEAQMRPKDKYTIFDRKEKRYRKAIHSMPFLSPPARATRRHDADALFPQNYPSGRGCRNESTLRVSEAGTPPAGLFRAV